MKNKGALATAQAAMLARNRRKSPHTGRPRQKPQGRRCRVLMARALRFVDELEAEIYYNASHAVRTSWPAIEQHALYYWVSHTEFTWLHSIKIN